MERTGIIYGINGPIVYLKGDPGFKMNELVYVGTENLVGEVIGLTSERTTIEVYEETSGLKPGESVTGSGSPVSVILAPGFIHQYNLTELKGPYLKSKKRRRLILTAA